MNTKQIFAGMLTTLFVVQSVFAQLPTPQFPTIKQAQTILATSKQKMNHGATLRVRAELNDLLPGDFVTTLVVYGKANQAGAKLEVIADQTILGEMVLPSSFAERGLEINMRNGVDYNRLVIRSIGKNEIQVLTANIGDPNAEPELPPLPPEPIEPPPVVIPEVPPTGPPGLNEFSANCKTRSNGVTFYDHSEQGAVWYCQNAADSLYNTHRGECEAMAECKNPRMKCSTSSNGIPVIGYEGNHTVRKCQLHPSTDPSECAQFIRCEGGGGNIPPPVIDPGPVNFFDAGKPCQTKSNGYKFSAFFLHEVIEMCGSWAKAGYTDREECRTVAFCNGDQGQIKPPPHPHPGEGHIGPLPGGGHHDACRTHSKGHVFVGPTRHSVVSVCQSKWFTSNWECEKNVNPGCDHHGGHFQGHHGPN